MLHFRILLLSAVFILPFCALANSVREGWISYTHVSGNTYEITVHVYTAPVTGPSDRCEIPVQMGDGVENIFARSNGPPIADCAHSGELLNQEVHYHQYTGQHTYGTDGTYLVTANLWGRIAPLANASNSVPGITVQSALVIDATTGVNSSVTFETVRTHHRHSNGGVLHSIMPIDPDSDSLSFEFVTPTSFAEQPLPGYSLPQGMSISPVSGRILWAGNLATGSYVVAVRATEWRNGEAISWVRKEILLPISSVDANANNWDALPAWNYNGFGDVVFSVEPNATLHTDFDYVAFAPDSVFLTGFGERMNTTGGPTLTNSYVLPSIAEGLVSWTPQQSDVRNHPYILTVRSVSGGTSPATTVEEDMTILVYVGVPIPPVNVAETMPTSHVLVFPNPASGSATVQLDELVGNAVISLVDATGRTCYTHQLTGPNTQLQLDDLASGLYLYQIEYEHQQPTTGRLIVH